MNKKVGIISLLMTSICFFSIFLFYKKELKKEIEEQSTDTKKYNFPTNASLPNSTTKNTDSIKNKEEYLSSASSVNSSNKNEPINIEQAEEEKAFLLEKIKRDNAIERLNNNNLTEAERRDYVEIYNRLSQLDSFIYKNKMNELSEKVAEVEAKHDLKLKELGISK
ncbi:hypothetical protein QEJ31_06995 [Pigmentibacter sp. JX0631]|uniref:hypothetical protein n=1 Tax=Pigmentibacter sp. JX0631 TaxID=2976982 RepID=UPI002469336A|nr:hypothetical protein [Pigmentibacter sp. JX0631]WGL61339.1 hypothetical protein QEJ31_06995 [Pigmentibacter sp. JX0631]